MNQKDFHRWFNRDFWEAFKKKSFPIEIPPSPKERKVLVESVYQAVISARYAPNIPETEIIMNKG